MLLYSRNSYHSHCNSFFTLQAATHHRQSINSFDEVPQTEASCAKALLQKQLPTENYSARSRAVLNSSSTKYQPLLTVPMLLQHFTTELSNLQMLQSLFTALESLCLKIIHSNSLTILQARRKAAWISAPSLEGQARHKFGTARLGNSPEERSKRPTTPIEHSPSLSQTSAGIGDNASSFGRIRNRRW